MSNVRTSGNSRRPVCADGARIAFHGEANPSPRSRTMIPGTSQRVPLNTSEHVNRQIRREMEERLAYLRTASPQEIDCRLEELEREWDIERTLEANAATVAFTGCLLTVAVDRRWLLLPMAVAGFLFQHAVQGWCPPLPVLRRLGFRTQREIDEERSALLAIRRDFPRGRSQALESRATPEPTQAAVPAPVMSIESA